MGDHLLAGIENGHAVCGVVGLGFIGTTIMEALIEAGFETHGFDRDPDAIDRASRYFGQDAQTTGRVWSVSPTLDRLGDADVVIVAVRLNVDQKGVVDLEPLRTAATEIRERSRRPQLIVLSSTVPPGTTRRLETWIGSGRDFLFAHAPERLAAGQGWREMKRTPHLVGGIGLLAQTAAESVLAKICDEVVGVSDPEVCELAKLLENAFRTVGIALVGEVSQIATSLGISAAEVAEAAATKPFGYYPFYPGPGVGGHCLPNDLRILQEAGKESGRALPLLDAATKAIHDLPVQVVDRLERLLSVSGVDLDGSSILLVGVGFKVGSPDLTRSPAYEVVRVLRRRGATVSFIDSSIEHLAVDDAVVPRVESDELKAIGFDGAVLLSGDATLDFESLERSIPVVLDAGGGRLLRGTRRRTHSL